MKWAYYAIAMASLCLIIAFLRLRLTSIKKDRQKLKLIVQQQENLRQLQRIAMSAKGDRDAEREKISDTFDPDNAWAGLRDDTKKH